MSPVVDTGDFVFFSGFTGAGPHGRASNDSETQFRDAFRFLRENLEAAGLSFKNVVDLTSYHVELRRYSDTFIKVKDEFIVEPYPAWTAIGVSELWFPDLLVELHIIANR
jgi:enamine deaminase RidA (YjgF/YER057c/UK114 family)